MALRKTNNADVTTWVYQEHSGLLTNKTDAAGRSVSYTYQNGLLQTTRRARGVSSYTYYNSYGDPFMTYYDDGVTPMVTFDNYNRMGLPGTIIDGSGTWLNTYDHAGRLVLSTNTAGPLCGIAVSNHFAALHGRDSLQVLGTAPGLLHSYGYDSYGRLATVAAGDYWASYGYLPNSDLLENTIFRSNTTEVLRTTRTWEYGMRLKSIANVVNRQAVSAHEYLYDSLHRRVQATLEDGTLWKYDYNDRNELIDAKRFWSDWTPYSGQQFGYLFDSIGNRMKAWEGGDNQGGNLREIEYSANELNQYTEVVTPGYKHISGVAFATNTVTVNSGATERRGEWFDREITINNAGSTVWQTVAAVSGNVTSNGGFAFPKNQQALSYDEDGNLTKDGIWTYEWDAENRLRAMWMTNFTGLNASNRLRLDFAYDYMGRRFSKTVSTWDSATETFTNAPTQYFVYDLGGWNLLATLNPQLSTLNSFLWGQDLSGTMTEAGGVGGLLAFLEISNSQFTNGHFTMYDGNGNVMGLTKANTTTSARFEYSPYGETVRATGPLALLNPFRFSTKFHDGESGLVYYGCRYYSPRLGRWICRDPIEESDGLNILRFACNSPIHYIDTLGASSFHSGRDHSGWHVHDGDLTYGFSLNDDGTFETWARKGHERQYDSKAAERSLREALADPNKRAKLIQGNLTEHRPGAARQSYWDNFPDARGVMTRQGRNLWRATKSATRGILGIMAIVAALEAGSAVANAAPAYGKFSAEGNVPMRDLEAITIALAVMEGTGNYFMGYLALDILLD